MSSPSDADRDDIASDSPVERIDSLLDVFESALMRKERPRIEQIAPKDPPPQLLEEMVHIEIEALWGQGERPSVESYLARFPHLAAESRVVLDLATAEFQLRKKCGEHASIESLCSRFPNHAETLRLRLAASAAEPDHPTAPSYSEGSTLRPDTGLATSSSLHDSDRFTTLSELGSGGMGVVYQVRDNRRNETVALKALPKISAERLFRFKREFRVASQLTHRNIISPYELIGEGDSWFFTMELVDGVDFLSFVRPQGRLDVVRLRCSLRQLAEGVHFLHAAGILHRDLKPTNALVESGGRVAVLDFGLISNLEAATVHQSTAGHLLGTAAYMAPEQAEQRSLAPSADWYSVGVMLYQALTGRLPFEGPVSVVLVAKQTEDPTPPCSVNSECPPDLSELCERLLSRSPQDRPGYEDILAFALADEAASTHTAGLQAAPEDRDIFVGRHRELNDLHEALSDAGGGRPVCVLLGGESGVGKTKLVHKFIQEIASERDMVVLSGKCHEYESVPYKTLDSLIDEMARWLASLPDSQADAFVPRGADALCRVFPVLRKCSALNRAAASQPTSIDGGELRRQATRAFREMVYRVGDRKRLVLVFDDLQWSDQDSADLLVDALQEATAPGLLVIGLYRNDPVYHNRVIQRLNDLGEQSPTRVLDRAVTTLGVDEITTLARGVLGEKATEAEVSQIVSDAGGHPYFAAEMARVMRSSHLPVSSKLGDVLRDRIDRLPSPCRCALDAVAVAGQPLSLRILRASLPDIEQVPTAVQQLVKERLLSTTGADEDGLIDTYHDRVRETLLDALDYDATVAIHGQIARAARDSNAEPELLALHFEASGSAEEASRYYADAAISAMNGLAFDHAAGLCLKGLRLVSNGETTIKRMLLETRGRALAASGRGADSADAYEHAARLSEGLAARRLRRNAAQQLLMSGHVDRGKALLNDVLSEVGMRMPASALEAAFASVAWNAKLRLRSREASKVTQDAADPELLERIDLAWAAAVGFSVTDSIIGTYFIARALDMSLSSGDASRMASGLGFQAAHHTTTSGRITKVAQSYLDEATKVARFLSNDYHIAFTSLSRGVAYYLAGDWEGGLRYCDEAIDRFRSRCTDAIWERDSAETFAMWSLVYMGRLKELRRRHASERKDAKRRGDLFLLTNLDTMILSYLRTAEDYGDSGKSEVQATIDAWPNTGFHVQNHNAYLGLTHLDLYRGDGAEAWQRTEKLWRRYQLSQLLRIAQVRVDAVQSRGRSALAAAVDAGGGRRRGLLRKASSAASRLVREGRGYPTGYGWMLRAGVGLQRGSSEAAARALNRAADVFGEAGMRLMEFACRYQLLRLGETSQANQQCFSYFSEEEVANPTAMSDALTPGFRQLDPVDQAC